MRSTAATVDAYLAALPDDRRAAIAAIRRTILKNLPKGYAEGMQYGMIGYHVPHTIYPSGYHCDPREPLPFASLASQKNHIGIYLMCIYQSPEHTEWFRSAWTATGKRLDMGKSCVRVRRLEEVPLEVVGEAIRRVPVKSFIAAYEAMLGPRAAAAKSKAPAKPARGSSPAGAKPSSKTDAKSRAGVKPRRAKAAAVKGKTKTAAAPSRPASRASRKASRSRAASKR